MKKNKKLLSIITMTLVLVLNLSTSVFAEDKAKKSDALEQLAQRYNLKTVEIIPEGVHPIVIENEKELAAFFENLNYEDFSAVKLGSSKIIQPEGIRYTYERTCQSGKTWGIGSFYLNLDVTNVAKLSIQF